MNQIFFLLQLTASRMQDASLWRGMAQQRSSLRGTPKTRRHKAARRKSAGFTSIVSRFTESPPFLRLGSSGIRSV